MKSPLFYFIFLLGLISASHANNITINNVSLVSQNTNAGPNNSSNFIFVKFDISWENSWRTSASPNNWDAAWVFIKFRIAGGMWQHVTLENSGHIAPNGSSLVNGLLAPATPYNSITNPVVGMFIHRSANGTGAVNYQDVKLKWNYQQNGVLDNNQVEVKVFGFEMVYVPQGQFYVGDGSPNFSAYLRDAASNAPYLVSSEAGITLGGTLAGNMIGDNGFMPSAPESDDFDNSNTQLLSAAFPKGFKGFYCMKYEISQKLYVDFLNTLTYSQQSSRTASSPNSPVGTLALTTPTNIVRNSIEIKTAGVSSTTPAVYACDLNGNGVYDEADDGQWIGCNFLSTGDVSAFLDWSGLRPMTELEFEKAGRGPLTPIIDEFAWGDNNWVSLTAIANGGTASEGSAAQGVNVNADNLIGPIRVGSFASPTTNRSESGASYYGIMDLSGNIAECIVSLTNAQSRIYTGIHGNGILSNTGMADVSSWVTRFGLRGGGWSSIASGIWLSDRYLTGALSTLTRINDTGGRGVRSAP